MICQGGFLYAQGHIVPVPALKFQTGGFLFSLLLPLLYGPIYLSGNLLDTYILSPQYVSATVLGTKDITMNKHFMVPAFMGDTKWNSNSE